MRMFNSNDEHNTYLDLLLLVKKHERYEINKITYGISLTIKSDVIERDKTVCIMGRSQ